MVRVYAFRAFSAGKELDLSLVKKAVELGADGVVLDVFLSRDGVPVASTREEVGGRRLSELDFKFLTGAVELGTLLSYSDVELLLWIRDAGALDVAARAVREGGSLERHCLVVDDVLQVRVVRSVSREVCVVTMVRNPFPNLQLISREGSSAIAVPASVLRPRLVRESSARRLKVFAWLVNDVSLAARVVRYGVELLVTSRPTLKKELSQYLQT
ncbi:MAG: glycerophosphodiester phosphodiesterase [Sulfolobales archaeon]|nr:glycerophosphodiester phosphodiesterase [Sulfolobales archaeon]MCX8208312.1 glycerophosphodiester phosphodiesterase [Sulfolobales archaeon]MDW8010010.1 glycerophosphodiester phosphodiesterase [Sulfolobales archaeon]